MTENVSAEEQREIKRIAGSLGKSEEELLEEIMETGNDSYPLAAKIAIFKINNKGALSGKKMRVHLIPVVKGDQIRTIKAGDKTLDVVDIIGFMNPRGSNNFELMQLSLWNDGKVNRCLLIDDVELDRVYTFDGSFNETTNKMSMIGEVFQEEEVDFDLLQAITDVDCITPDLITDNLNKPVFIEGYCGAVKNADDGRWRLIEIASITSDPVTVWLPEDYGTLDETEWVGHIVKAVGFGRKEEGKEPTFNARRAWAL